jgi:monofunctional biosynthetic peptidoglycan transglycosylase
MLKRFLVKIVVGVPVAFILLSLCWVLLYKYVPVKWTPLMLKRSVENVGNKEYRNSRTWVDIEDVAAVQYLNRWPRIVSHSEEDRSGERALKHLSVSRYKVVFFIEKN